MKSDSQRSKTKLAGTMGPPIQRSYIGVFMVFGLVSVTLYMAFAFPYSLFHLKQTETTEIKSVIIVARNGERSPSPESYFIGEEQPEELLEFGYEQLTNTGKERMYLLGKYLKLRYYQLLLNGDPRKVYVRSADSDRCLESAQSLLAGLNPPRDKWIWSLASGADQLVNWWQPKAVHSMMGAEDDLLSADSECLKLEDKFAWKNSTRYQQLLSEFRHDLQNLRANTGLEFEDDLEMLSNLEDALRTRQAFGFENNVPAWYTSTLASRLAHISDVTAESRFSLASVQRLYVGRLLYEIARNINSKIRLLSLASASGGAGGSSSGSGNHYRSSSSIDQEEPVNQEESALNGPLEYENERERNHQLERNKLKANPLTGPNMFIYFTSKHRLTALLNSLQIYSTQLPFGSLLLIELHYDPINQIHFLRLFTVSATSADSIPEPLRVNPKACLDSAECMPQQFEQNIRHLMLDKNAWLEACSPLDSSNYQQNGNFATLRPQPLWPSAIDEPTTSARPPSPATVQPPASTKNPASTPDSDSKDNSELIDEDSKLEDTLIVGPLGANKKDSNPLASNNSTAAAASNETATAAATTITAIDTD